MKTTEHSIADSPAAPSTCTGSRSSALVQIVNMPLPKNKDSKKT